MISKLFYSNLRLFGRMSVSSSLHYPLSHFSFIFSLLSFLFSLLFLSCNKPFQPEVAYTPELNVYSVLFSDAHGVYVRVGAVTESSSGVSQAMHGASVTLVRNGPNNSPVEPVTLTDTTALLDGVFQLHSTNAATHTWVVFGFCQAKWLPACARHRANSFGVRHDPRSEYLFYSPKPEKR